MTQKMLSFLLLLGIVLSSLCVDQSTADHEPEHTSQQRCLSTKGRHKEMPSRETLHECHAFADNACCTPNTTRPLADSDGTHIDTYFWPKCGNVSEECEAYIRAEMCFYFCSPNTYPWAKKIPVDHNVHPDDVGETYSGVPICGSWCDRFYAACQDQPICVTSWYLDWNVTMVNGRSESHCRDDSNCSTFGQRFGSAMSMCNGIFGDSYVYTSTADCLVMSFNSSTNPNDDVADRLASGAASHWSTALLLPSSVLAMATSLMLASCS